MILSLLVSFIEFTVIINFFRNFGVRMSIETVPMYFFFVFLHTHSNEYIVKSAIT